MRTPSVTVVVPAYNAERHIAETLDAILSQTHPADEVIVVDDGSTDGTFDLLERFSDQVRVVSQTNRGAAGAYNRGFKEASGDYIARCDADDIWEESKLEQQIAAVVAHPEIDIAFCAARFFGLADGPYGRSPGDGVLDRPAFASTLFAGNLVCASSLLIRRRLVEELGPLVDRLPCEDYDFLLRASAADAVFFHDPQELVRYRRHELQVTHDRLRMARATHRVHRWHARELGDQRLVNTVLAQDLVAIARLLVDEGMPDRARAAFVDSLRLRAAPHGLAWALLLSTPAPSRPAAIRLALSFKRACVLRCDAARPASLVPRRATASR